MYKMAFHEAGRPRGEGVGVGGGSGGASPPPKDRLLVPLLPGRDIYDLVNRGLIVAVFVSVNRGQ